MTFTKPQVHKERDKLFAGSYWVAENGVDTLAFGSCAEALEFVDNHWSGTLHVHQDGDACRHDGLISPGSLVHEHTGQVIRHGWDDPEATTPNNTNQGEQ